MEMRVKLKDFNGVKGMKVMKLLKLLKGINGMKVIQFMLCSHAVRTLWRFHLPTTSGQP